MTELGAGRRRRARRTATARVLTLQRPDDRNPLDHATVDACASLAEDADADPPVRVARSSPVPGPAFSAGGDLRAYLDLYRDEREFRAFLDDFRAAQRAARSTAGS